MKGLGLLALVGAAVFLSYAAVVLGKPCERPISYRLGSFDERFMISRPVFLSALEKAGALWSEAAGKKLFEYKDNGGLTVNLIYDERQQLTQQNQALESRVDQTKLSAEAAKQAYAALNEEYARNYSAYELALAQFRQDQESYNSAVAQWNKKGGAPKNVYDQLAVQARELTAQQNILRQKRIELIGQADEINALIAKYNLLVNRVNSNINEINQSAGKEFEEGAYIADVSGRRIDIYEFSDEVKLIRVLAHELGHALGLDHNGNQDSIMYELNLSRNVGLTVEDRQSLKARCGLE